MKNKNKLSDRLLLEMLIKKYGVNTIKRNINKINEAEYAPYLDDEDEDEGDEDDWDYASMCKEILEKISNDLGYDTEYVGECDIYDYLNEFYPEMSDYAKDGICWEMNKFANVGRWSVYD
jgi:hypothetical protein